MLLITLCVGQGCHSMHESAHQHNKRLEKNWQLWFEILSKILNNDFPHPKTILPALSMFVFFAQEGCIDDNDDDDNKTMLILLLMLMLTTMTMLMLTAMVIMMLMLVLMAMVTKTIMVMCDATNLDYRCRSSTGVKDCLKTILELNFM